MAEGRRGQSSPGRHRMKRNNNKLVEALQFYASPANWFGAPAPVYKDSGKLAIQALSVYASDSQEWWSDDTGLELRDIIALEKRLGMSMWDGVIHLGGVSTGIWRPWPGEPGDSIRGVLKLYESRTDFRRDNP